MAIQSIFSLGPAVQASIQKNPQGSSFEAQQKFSDFLKNAIQDVSNKQAESDVMTNKLIRGENVELHDVMIAAQKASIALNATMEVRNKIVEAYQEISRMPV